MNQNEPIKVAPMLSDDQAKILAARNAFARRGLEIARRRAEREAIEAAFVRPANQVDGSGLRASVPATAARPDQATGDAAVLLQCAADVKPQPVLWLWADWLPVGKLTVLAGAAGTGKTTLALSLAATVTRGGQWPDGTACAHPGQVLIWSSEDDPADTLVPRLMAGGADLNKVHFVCNVAKTDGELVPFDPARDMPLLSERMAQMGDVRLLIVDPILSAVGGDAHRANDVRRDLQPLVDLAARHGCAVIGISHFAKGSSGKSPVERVIGSQAFGALARMVLVTVKEDGAERRILARAKSNIAPDDGGFAYALERVEVAADIRTNAVIWGERIDGSARDIPGEVEQDPDADGERSEREDARDFLCSLLAEGPVSVRAIQAEARGAGISWRTIERAKRESNVEARKGGLKEGWLWCLPAEDRQPDNEDRQRNLRGGLRGAWRSSTTARVCDAPLSPDVERNPEDRHARGLGGLRDEDGDERVRESV